MEEPKWMISNDRSISNPERFLIFLIFFMVTYPRLAHNRAIAEPMDQLDESFSQGLKEIGT
jgi:hypothetical protein